MSGAYGRQPPALSHARQNQLLYIVTFKCHRADVFYIQEDTGLQVKAGDLVIVEADRGTDLGTVEHANVSLQRARELKQKYADEHYKWLMMFSRQGQMEGSNVASSGLNSRSATGGMGPHAHGAQEPATEIKPKLIKRLAQNHEILTLRDKEGNEAKAKRVCQQKVAEHRLNMEILDAEFQMYVFISLFPIHRRWYQANRQTGTGRSLPFTISRTLTSTSTRWSQTCLRSTRPESGCPRLTLPPL
jgi:hypothetical protein